MTKQEIESRLTRYRAVLEKTKDEKERATISGVIKMLENKLETGQFDTPAPEPKPEAAPEPEEKKEEKPAAEKPEKVKRGRKKEKPAKARKEKAEKPAKEPKKVEKTVKIAKVVPEEEKKNVKDILENEHYKVIIREKGGKKIKITVKNSDRVVAKNKIDSAFVTISKKVVDSEDERKKYADDIKALDAMKAKLTELIEDIYKAFNSHKTDELRSILKKLRNI